MNRVSCDIVAAAHIESPASQSLLAKTGFSAVAGFCSVIGRMTATIAAARILGMEQVGQLAYLLWAAESLAIVCGLGLPAAVTRFIAVLHGQGQVQAAAFVQRAMYPLYAMLALAGSIVCYVIGTRTLTVGGIPLAGLFFGMYFFLYTMGTFHIACLAGRQNFRKIAQINAYSAVLQAATVVGFTPVWGVTGALMAYLAAAIPPAVIGIGAQPRGTSSATASPHLFSRVLQYALFAWFGVLMDAFTWSRAEIFFLKRYYNAVEVATFTAGASLCSLATYGPTLLVGALLAHVAQLGGKEQIEQIKKLYVSGTRLMALLLFPLCFGLASITPVLLPLLYGKEFTPAVPSAVILIASSIVVISTVSSSILNGMGKSAVTAFLATLSALASTLAGLLIISKYGVLGAAWSRSAIQIGMVCIAMVYMSHGAKVLVPSAHIARTLLAAALSAASSGLLVWTFGSVTAMLCSIPLAGCVYLFLVRSLRLCHPDDVPILKRVLDRLPPVLMSHLNGLLIWLCGQTCDNRYMQPAGANAGPHA